jgi:hypothetical protein
MNPRTLPPHAVPPAVPAPRLMVAQRAEATPTGNPRPSDALGFAQAPKGDMAPLFAARESELPLLSPLCILPA